MNPQGGPYSAGTLHTTFLAAVAIATLGAVVVKGSSLPKPREYAAIFLAWFLLGIVSGFGRTATRWANTTSVLIVVVLLTQDAGARAVQWLSDTAAGLVGAGPSSKRKGQHA